MIWGGDEGPEFRGNDRLAIAHPSGSTAQVVCPVGGEGRRGNQLEGYRPSRWLLMDEITSASMKCGEKRGP